ncbi:hypothetical protein VTJ04DRAFT_7103 [Mycothermus thermophilus]|uniref:uncharacterized protein n=1 Tax=Humicola insolens TaxID=85995 RepID=UPI003742B418
MSHLPRWNRRKKDVAAPTLITSDLPAKTLAPTTTTTVTAAGVPASQTRGVSPMRSLQKLSPFRVFHRSSGKRARDSPPASLPHSPAAPAIVLPDGADGRPVSPLSLRTDRASDDEGRGPEKQPKMPAFLQISEEEIENKFMELVWRERHRMMQSVSNPSPDFRFARVKGPHLKVLDRYMNIQPWQNNRVRLQVPEGCVDYINASPIVLYPKGDPNREPDRYIAMQGPKQVSTDHVWRMIVEQLESPGVIVMLTETHEGPHEKCYPYFPRSPEDPPLEVNEHDEFGDGFRATVRCEGLEETPAGDAIELRKLVIRVHSRPTNTSTSAAAAPASTTASTTRPTTPPSTAGETSPTDPNNAGTSTDVEMTSSPPAAPTTDPATTTSSLSDEPQPRHATSHEPEERIVYHFLYKKWPDFGVPSLDDLGSFFELMRLSRERNSSPRNPRVVHCSAGVGRSGTFIALEHLMRELESGVLEDWDGSGSGSGSGEEGGAAGDGGSASSSVAGSSPLRGGDDQTQGQGGRKGEDLIFETVNCLREQRRTMVQAQAQYEFIYLVLRKLWIEKYGMPGQQQQQQQQQQVGGGGAEEVGGAAAAAASRSGSGSGNGSGNGDGRVHDGGSHEGEPMAKRLEVEPGVGVGSCS